MSTVANPASVVVRMPAELRDAVQRLAQDQDRSLAAEVRRALKSHVAAAGAA